MQMNFKYSCDCYACCDVELGVWQARITTVGMGGSPGKPLHLLWLIQCWNVHINDFFLG
jgi:hypothetical protein